MNSTDHESSREGKKHAPAIKYNKLSREQKMAIIRERAETHMSFASIAAMFSSQFGMKLSTRGVADTIAYWQENGKLRGESNAVAAQSDIVYALNVAKDICLRYGYSLTKAELKDFISCTNCFHE